MIITDNEDINKRFEEIHSKILNKQFVSAGTLLRFRDKCIMVGYFKAGEEIKEMIKKELKKHEHCKDTCESQEYDVLNNILTKIGDNSEVEK